MATSWYVSSGCIEVNELKPWSLICVGIVVQVIISAILMFTADSNSKPPLLLEAHHDAVVNYLLANEADIFDSSRSEHVGKCNCRSIRSLFSKIKDSRAFAIVKMLLLIWQFISVIMVLVLDIIKIHHQIAEFDSKWYKYQCFAAILLSSSNAKTCFAYAGAVVGYYFYFKGSSEPTLRVLNRKAGFSSFKMMFIGLCFLVAVLEGGSLIIFIVLGFMVYIWTWLAVFFIFVALIVCCVVTKAKRNNVKNVNDEEVPLGLYSVMPTTLIFFVTILGLVTINMLSGLGYWSALGTVLAERHWSTYIEYLVSSIEGKFRFATTLL